MILELKVVIILKLSKISVLKRFNSPRLQLPYKLIKIKSRAIYAQLNDI